MRIAVRPSAVRRLALVWATAATLLLVVFAGFETVGVSLLSLPGDALRQRSPAAAALGVSLLVVDVVLPVASSVVMVALGAVFGVMGGTALSTVGSLGSLVVAAALGRRGRGPMERFLRDDPTRIPTLLQRYGMAAVLASRPIPVVAESVAIVAGATGMAWWRLLLGGAAGTVPVALAYALAGAKGGQANGVVLAAILIALAIAALALPALSRVRHAHRPDRSGVVGR